MIKQITLDDLPFCMDLARRFWQVSQYGKIGLQFDETSMLQAILHCIKDGLALRSERGALLACIEPFWGNQNVRIAVEYVWRGAGEEQEFIKLFEQWARFNNADCIQFGVRDGFNNRRARKAATLSGFKENEKIFVKDLR